MIATIESAAGPVRQDRGFNRRLLNRMEAMQRRIARLSSGLFLSVVTRMAVAAAVVCLAGPVLAEDMSAKMLFGSKKLPAAMPSSAEGFYSRGCLAGGMAIPVDGPTWQVMRLSRNRRWGHPDLIRLIEELSIRAKADGWNGLMIGDISQPRGGPMLTGHMSHQIGLDADLWFMPMPDKRLTLREREQMSAVSVLKEGTPYVDDSRWTRAHARLLYHAASFDEVQRILVHPGVKKKLCETVRGNRDWLSKIRPYYGHHYHFHIRLHCPEGSPGCKAQREVGGSPECGDTLDWWFDHALKPRESTTDDKPSKRREITLAKLPDTCRRVLNADELPLSQAQYRTRTPDFEAPEIELPEYDHISALTSKPIEASRAEYRAMKIPVPIPRPDR